MNIDISNAHCGPRILFPDHSWLRVVPQYQTAGRTRARESRAAPHRAGSASGQPPGPAGAIWARRKRPRNASVSRCIAARGVPSATDRDRGLKSDRSQLRRSASCLARVSETAAGPYAPPPRPPPATQTAKSESAKHSRTSWPAARRGGGRRGGPTLAGRVRKRAGHA